LEDITPIKSLRRHSKYSDNLNIDNIQILKW
jgi:hypothetical protein